MSKSQHNEYLKVWEKRQEIAEAMVPIIGKIYRSSGVVLKIYGRTLINASPITLLKLHRYVRQFEKTELAIQDSFEILTALQHMKLGPVRIDLGLLAVQYKEDERKLSIDDFLTDKLAEHIRDIKKQIEAEPTDVVLYGFGRIGRLLARLLIERTGSGNKMRLRAIVVRKGGDNDLQKRASLLRRDSVHGSFKGTIKVDEENNTILANGNLIQVIYASHPKEIDYTKFGIKDALIVDNTGIRRDEAQLSEHFLAKGAAKTLLTAPGKDVKNIVYGVNTDDISPSDKVISAASCTTNAITPTLKAINDEYGIIKGHVETVHSYTNDQNLIDNYHKGERRGRAAALNMVITETGAAKAVSKALPELEGKLTGNAIRVPTPNVSMAILNLSLKKETDKKSLNSFLREIALHSPMREQIDFTTSTEIVSTDLVGARKACTIDSKATIASGDSCVLYLWYDNEFGYSCQVIRVMQKMAGLDFPSLPIKE
ncbi:MAG: glyceraldehyde-3-phosphate dehydrogenase [Cycloclasticus sp. symbiont of Poecilosclerida sp. M]|nr:MAG: glyceraldehyde-3-phosphate dehydrogenase [Cycloclasticus sp. symbiont of Poecilosclerida sp. M]